MRNGGSPNVNVPVSRDDLLSYVMVNSSLHSCVGRRSLEGVDPESKGGTRAAQRSTAEQGSSLNAYLPMRRPLPLHCQLASSQAFQAAIVIQYVPLRYCLLANRDRSTSAPRACTVSMRQN